MIQSSSHAAVIVKQWHKSLADKTMVVLYSKIGRIKLEWIGHKPSQFSTAKVLCYTVTKLIGVFVNLIPYS